MINKSKKIKIESIYKLICILVAILFLAFAALNFNMMDRMKTENHLNGNDFYSYMKISILVSITIFVLLIVALLFVRRLTKNDMSYILRAFKNLSNFNYDTDFVESYIPYFTEEDRIKNLIHDIYKEAIFLEDIKDVASNEYVLDRVLEKVFDKLNEHIRVDRIGVAFADYNREKIIAETAKINYGKVLLGIGFEVSMANTSLVDILETKQSKINNNLMAEKVNREDRSIALDLIVEEGIHSNMIIPLVIDDKAFGILFFSSFEKESYDKKSLRIAENVAHSIATIINQAYLTKTIFNNITYTFAELVEKKDLETGDHINRMTKYSLVLAEHLYDVSNAKYEVNSSFMQDMELYAPLHDIGKVGIPDKILNKPGKFTPEEWAIMKEHANIGADIISNLRDSLEYFGKDFYQMALDIIRHHHERWDGTGYPYGLKGEEIPLSARIVAIADVFDALASKRSYKERMTFEECVEIILESRGSHFDPVLVDVFEKNLSEIRKIYDADCLVAYKESSH